MRILCFTPMVLTLFFAGYGEASSIFLDLGVSEKRCIADSVQGGADTRFRYRSVKSDSAENVKVKVTDPLGHVATRNDLSDKWGKNVIDNDKHPRGGTYKICFQNSRGKVSRVELQHDLISEETSAEDEDKEDNVIPDKTSAKDKGTEKAHELLKNSQQMLESLKDQMKETGTSEVSDEHEHIMLRSRINTGSCFTMVVLIAASAWQLVLLNKFFRSKKLI